MFQMKLAFILLVACAAGYSSQNQSDKISMATDMNSVSSDRDTCRTPPQDGDSGNPPTVPSSFEKKRKNVSYSGDEVPSDPNLAPRDPSKSERYEAVVKEQEEAFRKFMRAMLLLPPQATLPESGSALYAMLSDIPPRLYGQCVDRINSFQNHVHPQYQRNLVLSLCQLGFERWNEQQFACFFDYAKILLPPLDDCCAVITAVDLLLHDSEFKRKMALAIPFCLGRTSMDIYVILSAIQESSSLPERTDQLPRFFSGLPAESFRDFMRKYQVNREIEERILGYKKESDTPKFRYDFLTVLLGR